MMNVKIVKVGLLHHGCRASDVGSRVDGIKTYHEARLEKAMRAMR